MPPHSRPSALVLVSSLACLWLAAGGAGPACAEAGKPAEAAQAGTATTEVVTTVTEPAKTVTKSITEPASTVTVSRPAKTVQHTVTQTVEATPTATASSAHLIVATPTSSESSEAVPVWGWVLIGLAVLAAIAGAFYFGQRRGQADEEGAPYSTGAQPGAGVPPQGGAGTPPQGGAPMPPQGGAGQQQPPTGGPGGPGEPPPTEQLPPR